MGLSNEQKYQLNRLIDNRDEIVKSLFHIERILKVYFPEEFDLAYQFYIPQISTAIHENKNWLSRGGYSLQNTIDKLLELCKDDSGSATTKYLKG